MISSSPFGAAAGGSGSGGGVDPSSGAGGRRRRLGSMGVAASPRDDKKERASLQERMAIKVQALVLVGVAAATAYATDFFHVLLDDPRVYRGYFRLACTCLGANLAVGVYLMVWLPRTRGNRGGGDVDHLAMQHPQLVPAATAAGVLGAFFLVRSLWPVWGFLAPLILLTVLVGAIYALHFVPWPF